MTSQCETFMMPVPLRAATETPADPLCAEDMRASLCTVDQPMLLAAQVAELN